MTSKGKAAAGVSGEGEYQPKASIHPSLINRRVLVTGGASGIGAAVVSHFHTQGARVAFLDRDEEAGEALAARLAQGRAKFIPCNLADMEDLGRGLAAAEAWLGALEVLVNNAGDDRRHSALDVDEKDFDALLAVNLKQQFFAAQHAIASMVRERPRSGGVVLNVSSGCWLIGKNADYPVYMMAKAAVHGMTQSLGREFGALGVRVNTLIPGWVATEKQLRENLTPAAEARLMDEQCIRERVTPSDVAKLALFLASDDARLLTKQMFTVDAGWI